MVDSTVGRERGLTCAELTKAMLGDLCSCADRVETHRNRWKEHYCVSPRTDSVDARARV